MQALDAEVDADAKVCFGKSTGEQSETLYLIRIYYHTMGRHMCLG